MSSDYQPRLKVSNAQVSVSLPEHHDPLSIGVTAQVSRSWFQHMKANTYTNHHRSSSHMDMTPFYSDMKICSDLNFFFFELFANLLFVTKLQS